MQIRKATMKDAEALLSLYEDLGYPTTPSKLARRLEMILSQPHYGCLLAERNGEILGFLGYAKLFFFEEDVKEGVKALALNSGLTAERNAAHQFYQAVGFEKVTAGFALHLKTQHE